jgi:hypothetical protein
MSRDGFDEANKQLHIPFLTIETRRNLFINNISATDLLGLIDKEL